MTYKEQFEIGAIGSDDDYIAVYDGLYTDFISMRINDSEAYCGASYNFSDADEIKELIIILIKALGLLHKQVKKDSAMSRVGIPDYLMIFRKDGEHEHPVHCDIPVDIWQKWASPVWMDIDYQNTLNAASGRDSNDEKHICPLQLDTIERAINLWSNEGDVVLTPFMGIGSEVYEAIKLKRFGIGFELKDSYFAEAVKNCRAMEFDTNQKSLFD